MEDIVINYIDEAPIKQITLHTDGYIPPDRAHFNYWTFYLDKSRMNWKKGPDSIVINSDRVKSISIKEVEEKDERV